METCCRCLLLLGILAAAATAVPSQHKTLSYEEAVALAVDFYNQGSGIDHAFRLLKANPQPEWDVSSKTIQSLTFTVKETVCLVSGNRDPNQCEFKEDGVRITPCWPRGTALIPRSSVGDMTRSRSHTRTVAAWRIQPKFP
uniref:Cathelicidin n=1 Tax=Chelonoidis abingdonii TaxID=106734 RepID=A0A8C0H536_CHEAB